MFLKKRNNFINSQFKSKLSIKEILGTAESVMCDVIKIRLKGRDERRNRKENS